MPAASPPDLAANSILILGAQRSGTTWLGKIFDSHPSVIFRNEPDETCPAPPGVTGEALRQAVNGWIHQRDLRNAGKRPFFPKAWQSAPAYALRNGLNVVMSTLARLPGIGSGVNRLNLPDLAAIDRAPGIRGVVKSISWCDGAGAFASSLPDSRTVLILRHPCGQVASIMRGARQRRFTLREPGTDMPFDEVQATAFAAQRGVDNAAFQALPDAAKYAWSWLAFNETACAGLAGRPNARTILYEDLCARPEQETRSLFAFAGLDWNAQTARFLEQSTSRSDSASYYAVFRDSIAAAQRWRSTMSAQDQDAVHAVVKQSRLAHLWPDIADSTQ
jgi:hypothetical protein